ncbi:patatin-like phospholipase family protein [Nitrosospira briensis]|uniref:patatin-like phospholipase family protein n=1 Tax=Nitrosospira briensis TaxID=35799 RepID=UPI0008EB124D|nr:patatin-like phospholipase family protein [Nitrosospira briensis]SFO38432.1 Predicted acylesterase/phospholipase RssA, contains patatin domain [Nitrosospira briensis]
MDDFISKLILTGEVEQISAFMRKGGIMEGLSRPAAALTVSLIVTACGALPYHTAQNQALCDESSLNAINSRALADCRRSAFRAATALFPVSRARDEFSENDNDLPNVFVGLALSGGGSRAANFAMATMQQLEELGLMRHVTAISATSGGTLAGAYYALEGPDVDWATARELMATNFLRKWAVSNILPHNLLKTSFTHGDRSDLMADVFDKVLFKKATFSDLGKLAPGRPIFITNATTASTGGMFAFTQKIFESHLNSRLDTYPLSHAVMASAAFPGVFNSVTLKSYPSGMPRPPGSSFTDRPRPQTYVHLIDGGPSDNLGLQTLLPLARSHNKLKGSKTTRDARPSGCFLIIVDAYPSGIPSRNMMNPDSRRAYDHLIDFNFLNAFDALLSNRRSQLLGYLGLGSDYDPRGLGGWIHLPGLANESAAPTNALVDFDVPKLGPLSNPGENFYHRIQPVREPPLDYVDSEHLWRHLMDRYLARQKEGEPPVPKNYFRCTAWHISLDGLMGLESFVGQPGDEPRPLYVRQDEFHHADSVPSQRARLKKIVSQIETNFELTGPANCSARLLQDSLYAAAFAAVRENHNVRVKVCDWFEKKMGLNVSNTCRTFPGNQSLALTLNIRSSSPLLENKAIDEAVECVKN